MPLLLAAMLLVAGWQLAAQYNAGEQHVVTFLRRAAAKESLIVVNLANTPFRGSLEAAAGNWKEVELPGFQSPPSALPFVSLDSFGARVFSRPLP